MNNNLKAMKHDLHLISHYQSLKLSRYYIIITTIIGTVYQSVQKYSASSIYILMASVLMPGILSYFIKSTQDRYTIVCLLTLKQKYNYTESNYKGHIYGAVLYSILLAIWQISNIRSPFNDTFINFYPSFILVSYFIIRFVSHIIYFYKLQQNLNNNRINLSKSEPMHQTA